MSLYNTIRNTIVPVHKEGYPFVLGFFVVSLVLGWLFKPLFWIGLMLIGVVLFLPNGILGGLIATARKISAPRRGAGAGEEIA